MKIQKISLIIILIIVIGIFIYFNKHENLANNPPETQTNSNVVTLGETGLYGEQTSEYTIKNNQVYYQTNPIDADADSIKVIKGNLEYMKNYITYKYARDINNIYYEGKKLPSTSIKTFTPLENGYGVHNYGTDGQTVYFGNEPILGADPETFKILWKTQYEGCSQTPYSKDSKNIHFKSSLVSGADPETFESLINGLGKDKRGYYSGNTYISPTIDPEKLVCNYG
jgi:hypothetical protein